uniref:PH domain-containing protein n=1 Tax=Prymnesium polylepis TaxID=72548 RepID=A0A6V4C1C9_9EUKA|mmetsp:Transcript_6872/g.16159  ORF Transcript_6872/g.16159 Transcript_6872/m.16159 type:complete len:198 (-) Transcript_6872:47-640(-)|eukprot:70593-Prymnesium_polylepis.1
MPIFGQAAPAPDPPLANEPARLVEALGGPLGDVAHDEKALARATALATGSKPAFFSHVLLRQPGCFSWYWTRAWAVVQSGSVVVYPDQAATAPLTSPMKVEDCLCEVGEREECKTDFYCFRLVHAQGSAIFCAYSSKEQILWLQALQKSGVRYEEPSLDIGGVTSIFQHQAKLLSGELVDLSRYAGCVCLVVNVASK